METLHQIEKETQKERDHHLEEIQEEEEEEEEDPCMDTLFLEEDKHRKPAMANL